MRSNRWLAILVVLVLASVPWRAVPAQGVVDVVVRVQVNFSVLADNNITSEYIDSVGVSCTAHADAQSANEVTSDMRLPIQGTTYGGLIDVKLRLTPTRLGEPWDYQCHLMEYDEQLGWRVAGTSTWLETGNQPKFMTSGQVQAY